MKTIELKKGKDKEAFEVSNEFVLRMDQEFIYINTFKIKNTGQKITIKEQEEKSTKHEIDFKSIKEDFGSYSDFYSLNGISRQSFDKILKRGTIKSNSKFLGAFKNYIK